MPKRDKLGRFKKQRGWYVNEKGYPRYSAGPNRGKYVHRVKMALHLRRELTKDEDVHHQDGDKKNWRISNLEVQGHDFHGWFSAAQHWLMQQRDIKAKKEWDAYFGAPAENMKLPLGKRKKSAKAV